MGRIRLWLAGSGLILLACSGSNATDAGAPGPLGPGKWGGPHAGLDVTAESATLTFDFCASGSLTVPILLTPDGRFDVPGTYVRNVGPSIQAKSARYVGLRRTSLLTVTVLLSDPIGPNDSDVVGPFDLVPGKDGPPTPPCPIDY